MIILKSMQDVLQAISNGEYVVRYVITINGSVKPISAYHICNYGLEAFSFDTKSETIPFKPRRANVYFPDRIEYLDEEIRKHIENRWDENRGGYIICDELLDMENIDKPCRFARFKDAKHIKKAS